MLLRDKISELFNYRRLPWMIKFIENEGDRQGYLESLINLQSVIFYYDRALEKSWELNHERLEVLWNRIQEQLVGIVGEKSDSEAYLTQIRTYALNEMSLRTGLHLTSLPIRYFYYYKSCDVRLMRRLILEKCGAQKPDHDLSDWLVFDWVTEVNDDVNDVFEDMFTFNGNRFLHSCRHYGIQATVREYLAFLDYLKEKVDDMPDEMTKNRALIRDWTYSELSATRDDLGEMLASEKLANLTRRAAINDGIN